MGKNKYKVSYVGARRLGPDWYTYTQIEPKEFESIYVAILSCKPNQFSEGSAKKQIIEIAKDRFPTKDTEFKFQLVKTPNKFYFVGEHYSITQHQQVAKEVEKEKQKLLVRRAMSALWGNELPTAAILQLIKKYPELQAEYLPYLAYFDPAYQYHESTGHEKNALMFKITKDILDEVQKYATEKRFSFRIVDLNQLSYSSSANGYPKIAVFGADDPKRLVAVKFKILMWQEQLKANR